MRFKGIGKSKYDIKYFLKKKIDLLNNNNNLKNNQKSLYSCEKFCYDLPPVKEKRSAAVGYGTKYDFTKLGVKVRKKID